MNSIHKLSAVAAVLATSAVAAGCGSSSSSSSASSSTSAAPAGASTTSAAPASASTTSASAGSPAALSAEAQSAATGDIPDNQVFLVLHNAHAGYAMKYPEGWTIQGSGSDTVTIRDKNNLVRVAVAKGAAPSTGSVARQLTALKTSSPSLTFSAPQSFSLPASSVVVKAVYTTQSAPNPVTGKRVLLIVDRYVLSGPGERMATIDLGTPKGVDNVDAYRMMIQSFTWK